MLRDPLCGYCQQAERLSAHVKSPTSQWESNEFGSPIG